MPAVIHPLASFGVPRRTLLKASVLGLPGLLGGWTPAARANGSASAWNNGGRAKRCILLFMWGGPSHIDTFDPKPEAPDNVRGPFQTIATNAPGIYVSEHFSRVAQHADKLAIIRSLTHDDPAHLSSVHTLLTGHLPPVNKSDAEPPSDRDSPCLASIVSKLWSAPDSLPTAVTTPWIVSHPAAPGGKAPGQHAGWLGREFDPFLAGGDPNQPNWTIPALSLLEGQSPDRLATRRALLESLEAQQRWQAHTAAGRMGQQQSQAFDLLTSSVVRGAFDLNRESPETRERYGRNTHGQCVLLARRLLDHGVPFVSVNWHNDGQNFWDTHGNNFNRLQNDLIPPSDMAFSALLEDLSARGQLDETLVVWIGEFGRSPHINGSAGREHYPGCYSAVMAGGGVRGGQLYGASDAIASAPISDPTSPVDITATICHAFGIDSHSVLHDTFNRPHRVSGGTPLTALF